MYTDPFFDGPELIGDLRLATTDQIVAMKMQAINTGGRKKDWWDIHLLFNYYGLEDMMALHNKWVPWQHEENVLLEKLIDFSNVNDDPDPICLLGKNWDEIRMDIFDLITEYKERTSRISY